MGEMRLFLQFIAACVIGVALILATAPRHRFVMVNVALPAPGVIPVDLYATYGWASWYGKPFHGRKTADGTVYNMGGYSVAHKTMKLGTFVRITSTRTGLSCLAIVNDRGPYVEGRDLDVSKAVAKRLGMVGHGVIPVKIEEIR